MKILLCSFLVFFSLPAFSQLVEYPLGSFSQSKKKPAVAARTQVLSLNLPFWDDFSFSDSVATPNRSLWLYGASVLINNGIGINQPTKNVASFDGADSVGKPYNVNDQLAKGFADSLVSQPIRMDLVDPALRGTVFFSFFYQVQGNAESPDPGDQLIVSFRRADLSWDNVLILENDGSQDPKTFYQIPPIAITDQAYYHDKFQFRIRNFARISGPYDTWNVDYIYLNSGRSSTDTSYPDRSVSSQISSLFNDFYAIPLKHFSQNPAANIRQPTLTLYNMKAGNFQPFDYTTEARFITKTGSTITKTIVPLDTKQDPGTLLIGQQFLNLTLHATPPPSAFNSLADSIGIRLKYGMSTKDNVPPGPLNGDYDPAKYSPIDFRTNDSIRANYVLSTYYAYDDGGAEYGAGLNQAGSYLAFKYKLKSNHAEKMTYVDIYFPQFGDFSNQSITLQIRSDLSDSPASVLYAQTVVVKRTTQNKFTRYVFTDDVPVLNEFYVGFKQLATANIPVGLDKNNDNADKIYYNTNGTWIQNTLVRGSMMIRPGFGTPKSDDTTTGLETESDVTPVYPNPAHRVCYLPLLAEEISVIDVTGRPLNIEVETLTDKKSLTFPPMSSGLVVVRYFIDAKRHTEKVMVLTD